MADLVGSTPNRPWRVALIGNPNTGKSTLFNALSGLRVRTGNYPGVTVEQRVGRVVWGGREVDLLIFPVRTAWPRDLLTKWWRCRS